MHVKLRQKNWIEEIENLRMAHHTKPINRYSLAFVFVALKVRLFAIVNPAASQKANKTKMDKNHIHTHTHIQQEE